MKRFAVFKSQMAALALLLFWGTFVAQADPKSAHKDLHGEFLVGFQGWFMCPGDGRKGGGWWHWFSGNRPDLSHLHIDLLPDTSKLEADERCPTELTTNDGKPFEVFSDQNPKTVLRQFEWMRTYGIGVALQRFLVDIDPVHPAAGHPAVDRVLNNVLAAAETTDRGLLIMYDVVGADPSRFVDVLVNDWKALLASGITKRPIYQFHKGRPVVAIAGIGSKDRPGTADQALELIERLRKESEPYGGVTLIGSLPTGWRTLDRDANSDPKWSKVYASFDIIGPWTVGRYRDAKSFDQYVKERLLPDIAEAKRLNVEYLPVIYPGSSAHNMYAIRNIEGHPLNSTPRDCGRFLWMQAVRNKQAGAQMLYGAMFDEVDEGTALFMLATSQKDAPRDASIITADQDGCRLPADWYLRLSGEIGKMLKNPAPPDPKLPLALP